MKLGRLSEEQIVAILKEAHRRVRARAPGGVAEVSGQTAALMPINVNVLYPCMFGTATLNMNHKNRIFKAKEEDDGHWTDACHAL